MIADSKTNILLLDDDAAFVEVTSLYLEKKLGQSAKVTYFTDPDHYFNHILSECYLPESPQDIVQTFYANPITNQSIKQTLLDLSELPAILVVDHHLRNQSTNGIEISKKIHEYIPCPFVILLTSELHIVEAIDLHNNDLIDLFVQKNGIQSLDYLANHLEKQIETIKMQFQYNIEDAFGFDTQLETQDYIAKRTELLNEIDYKSYLTVSAQGGIALLDTDNQLKQYSYHNKAFYLNG
ncbi:MAG: hypothetical protein AB7D28_03900 [Candidatus Berkiella sp.]